MAIKKETKVWGGIVANYHRIIRRNNNYDVTNAPIVIVVGLYISNVERLAGERHIHEYQIALPESGIDWNRNQIYTYLKNTTLTGGEDV